MRIPAHVTLLAIGAAVLHASLHAPRLGAQDRALDWPTIEVTAHLDADGRLRVQERQTIRLSGDWNGPERRFDVRIGQSLVLHSLTRRDSLSGMEIPLREGGADAVDEYRWADGYTVRWRSRLPDAPLHDNTTLVYTFDVSYDGIVRPAAGDNRYLLDHDFAFADRWDSIDRFTLTLTLDPVWEAPPEFTGRFDTGPLQPGYGFTVTVPLRYIGATKPAAVVHGAEFAERRLIAQGLILAALVMVLRLVFIERSLGRFAPLPHQREVTREWLEQHVLAFPPEVIGTAWDDTTAAPEVAATLARLVVDGKLESSVKETKVWMFRKQVLHLKLLVDRHTLSPHDLALINALFDANRDRTDTEKVRERYSATGFNPASIIKPGVQQMLESGIGLGGTVPKPSRLPAFLLLIAGLVLIVMGATRSELDLLIGLRTAALIFAGYLVLCTQTGVWQQRVVRPAIHLLLRVVVPMALAVWLLAQLILSGAAQAGVHTLAGIATLALAFLHSALNLARSRHDAERTAVRKRLAVARAHFARELATPTPRLDDRWLPWVLGFGLGRKADQWFRAFGAAGSDGLARNAGARGFSGSSSGSGWTGFGGGGGFAGAGSSGSFAAAVGGMAASVAAPSSSSGGGGGGGGGSSGGGGGGGW
jgi:uncharacterized membrane protein YgcG